MTISSPAALGNCTRIVDEETEEICNRPGFDEVLVRSKFGLFAVPLCKACKIQHYEFYAELRSRSRPSVDSPRISQSRGREHDGTDISSSTILRDLSRAS